MTNATAWTDGLFSPDNRHFALVGENPIAGIWDLSTGTHLRLASVSREGVSVAFSPDGKRVAVSTKGHTVHICETLTGKPVLPAIQQPNLVRQLRFSPDGKRLATACSKTGIAMGYAMLLDVATGKQLGASMGHLDDVLTVEFSHDGKRVITGCDDRAARIWNAFTGEPAAPPLWHAAKVIHAVFAPGDAFVATLTGRGDVQLWSSTTGEPISQPISHLYAGEIGHLSFSSDGHRLVIATGGEAAWLREFVPDMSPVSELILRAQVLSGRRLDSAVGLIPVEPEKLREVLQAWDAQKIASPSRQ
jgi:WD40 repeat protein